MFLKLSSRAAPILVLVLSAIWTAGVYFPFFYSIVFPNQKIQHLVGALEGRGASHQEISSLVQGIVNSSGHLKHAIRVAAYYEASAEYKSGQSYTSTQTEFAYVAWFEKQAKPIVLVISVTETDKTTFRFDIRESSAQALIRILLLPLIALAFSTYWFRRSAQGLPGQVTQT